MKKFTDIDQLSLRTDNIEGARVVPATDWTLWAVAAFCLLLAKPSTSTGVLFYAIGIAALALALAFSFFFKKVQVLKQGQWETLARLASPAQGAEIIQNLKRPVSPTD